MSTLHYHVIVVGGGLAGVAAACAAGRLGARTLLVEDGASLGGNVSQAWVHTICGLYLLDTTGSKLQYVNESYPATFVRELKAFGGALDPEPFGRVTVVPIVPERMGAFCKAQCDAIRSVEVLVEARPIAADLRAEARCRSQMLIRARNGAIVEAETQVLIDASGDGAAAELVGADLLPQGPLSAPSLIFRIGGVDTTRITGFHSLRITTSIARAAGSGDLPASCESVLVRPAHAPGAAHVTLNLPPLPGCAYDPLDAEYMGRLMTAAVNDAARVVAYLRAARPEFAQATITGFPRRIGVRETRRIAGEVTIEETEVLDGFRRDEDVALSSWPIELWSDHRYARFRYPKGACGIPLGALRSCSHPELGMAGRCISASHRAMGSLRVLGTALATGEAIGIAAGLAVKEGVSLRAIRARDLRAWKQASP